jgi:hypothetical protein
VPPYALPGLWPAAVDAATDTVGLATRIDAALTRVAGRFGDLCGAASSIEEAPALEEVLARLCDTLVEAERAGLQGRAILQAVGPARQAFRSREAGVAERLASLSAVASVNAMEAERARWARDLVEGLAARRLPDASVLVVDGGTTVEAVSSLLASHVLRLTALLPNEGEPIRARLAATGLHGRLTVMAAETRRAWPRVRSMGPFDLVMIGDRCDTTSDAQLGWLLPKLAAGLRPGGMLAFSTFGAPNPHRAWMSYLADLHVFDRSERGVAALLETAGLGALPHQVERRALGLFVSVRRPAA